MVSNTLPKDSDVKNKLGKAAKGVNNKCPRNYTNALFTSPARFAARETRREHATQWKHDAKTII